MYLIIYKSFWEGKIESEAGFEVKELDVTFG